MRICCAISAAALAAGCGTIDPGDPGFEPVTAPPDPALFAAKIQPILGSRCADLACHGGTGTGFRLEDPAGETAPEAAKTPEALPPKLRANYGAACLRISFGDPEDSDLLVKASGKAPHDGGAVLAPDGPEYREILAWILTGETG